MYLHRDISWMYFNRRILQEAERSDVPLLERLSFLGIYSNNLDEFFKVRVASLNRIVESEDKTLRKEQEAVRKTLKAINKLNNAYAKDYQAAINEVTRCLDQEHIHLIDETKIDSEQRDFVYSFYRSHLCGRISPIWMKNVKVLGDERDDRIHLAVKLGFVNSKKRYDYALLSLSKSVCGRFVQLPSRGAEHFLMYLDDVVRVCLPLIFNGIDYDSYEAYSFKFTKDGEMEIDNDLRNGMLQKISKGVKSRKRGLPLRIIYDSSMPREVLRRVMNKLDVDKLDTVLAGGKYQNHSDLMAFPDCGRTDLKYSSMSPVLRPELNDGESLLALIRKKDRFIHVPYHSFDSYIRVLQEAAIHPRVKAIKTTLYRLAKDSKVVESLICAARNGKKVTVVIELLARFDEASNIDWSKKMQDAGVHVVFGVEGLKVHSKITYINMQGGADIACISTGNFHEGNAKIYTDYILMTASANIVSDVNHVFSFIERPYAQIRFRELFVSPNEMKRKLISLINNEIKNKLAGRPAYIRMKVNHITDIQMVNKLYEASANRIPIDLLVRGNCSIVPGIEGVSDTIRINGIIDRYLEHSRIFHFCADGEDKLFIGSADLMPRNLDYRIEVIAPVYDAAIKADLMRVIDYGLADSVHGRAVDGYGENRMWEGKEGFSSQTELYKWYSQEKSVNSEHEINKDKNK